MRSRHVVVVAALVGAWAFGNAPALAQTGGPVRVALSVEAGVFVPADSAIKAVYPDAKVPFVVLADVGAGRAASVFVVGRLLRTSGHPTVIGGGSAQDNVDLRVGTIQAGLRAHHRRGRADLFVGLGVTHASYTESWNGTDESVSGGVWGPAAHAGVAVNLHRRLAVVSRVEWSLLKTEQGSVGSPSVNLGGFDVLGGIAVRF
jgi:hypothetical protein